MLVSRRKVLLPLLAGAVALLALPLHAVDAATTRLTIRVSGIRNANGKVRIHLFNAKDGFPSDDAKAFRLVAVAIHDGVATTTFADVPAGSYAVSCYHDENGNGKFDTRFPGIPTEGYAISNDVRGKLGPPPFEPAKFAVSGPQMTLALTMHH